MSDDRRPRPGVPVLFCPLPMLEGHSGYRVLAVIYWDLEGTGYKLDQGDWSPPLLEEACVRRVLCSFFYTYIHERGMRTMVF